MPRKSNIKKPRSNTDELLAQKVKLLEEEIKRLKKENRSLKRKITTRKVIKDRLLKVINLLDTGDKNG